MKKRTASAKECGVDCSSGETERGRDAQKMIDRGSTCILLCSYIPGKFFPGDHFRLVQPKFSGKVYYVERDTLVNFLWCFLQYRRKENANEICLFCMRVYL